MEHDDGWDGWNWQSGLLCGTVVRGMKCPMQQPGTSLSGLLYTRFRGLKLLCSKLCMTENARLASTCLHDSTILRFWGPNRRRCGEQNPRRIKTVSSTQENSFVCRRGTGSGRMLYSTIAEQRPTCPWNLEVCLKLLTNLENTDKGDEEKNIHVSEPHLKTAGVFRAGHPFCKMLPIPRSFAFATWPKGATQTAPGIPHPATVVPRRA